MDDPIVINSIRDICIKKRIEIMENKIYDRNILEKEMFHRNLLINLNKYRDLYNKKMIFKNKNLKSQRNKVINKYKLNLEISTRNLNENNLDKKNQDYRKNIMRNLINKSKITPSNEINKLIQLLKKINK